MCLDFYTLERRGFGQGAERGARVTGSPKIARFLGYIVRMNGAHKNRLKSQDFNRERQRLKRHYFGTYVIG